MSEPQIPEKILACLRAPGGSDETSLEIVPEGFRCVETGEVYENINGIPSLFNANDNSGGVTSTVKSFYEEFHFPSYEGLEEFAELVNKGYSNPFSKSLLRSLGHNKMILECGCGTGQLSHFLQLNNNNVLGIDMSLGSLSLAIEHKTENGLERSAFIQMNIYDMAVKDNSMDFVIFQGVLHHTYDARRAFAQVVRKAKPGGIIMVGLYNYFARVPTWLRSKLIGVLGPNIDYVLRNRIHDPNKRNIWIKDQYFNPHETWHSIDDTLGWFEENNVEFLNCSPAIMGTDGEETSDVFASTSPGNKYQRIVTQLSWLSSIAREGALFDLVGRKRG